LSVLTEERLIQLVRETIELERDCLDRIIRKGLVRRLNRF